MPSSVCGGCFLGERETRCAQCSPRGSKLLLGRTVAGAWHSFVSVELSSYQGGVKRSGGRCKVDQSSLSRGFESSHFHGPMIQDPGGPSCSRTHSPTFWQDKLLAAFLLRVCFAARERAVPSSRV
eukprot:361857-Chlamydomonas_euryale.AAC.6